MPRRPWTDVDGTVDRTRVSVSRTTGCLRWRGRIHGRCSGPTASLPKDVADALGWPAERRCVSVRKWVWQRAGREVPAGMMVAASCGDRQCIAVDHAELRWPTRKITSEVLEDLVARRPHEGTGAAARRLGVSRPTILRNLGPVARQWPAPMTGSTPQGDRRMATRRRAWIVDRLPDECPAEIRPLDWHCACRYADGQTHRSIAEDIGVSDARVGQRIDRLCRHLGWSAHDVEQAA